MDAHRVLIMNKNNLFCLLLLYFHLTKSYALKNLYGYK